MAIFLENHEKAANVLNATSTAAFTAVLAVSTLLLWKETRDLRNFAQDQSNDTKAAIREAVRSADAMQRVADAVTSSARATEASIAMFKDANMRQMRAYLTVGLGGVIEQNPSTNYKYEVRMTLQNVGNTPAYHVASVVKTEVLPVPLPTDYKFPSVPPDAQSEAVVGPHQSFIVSGVAPTMYDDADANEIKTGTHKLLYVFAEIRYLDAFDVQHHTNFADVLLYLTNGTFMTRNLPTNNDAD